MFRGDIFVLELVRLGLGCGENLIESVGDADVDRTAVGLGQSVHNPLGFIQKTLEINTYLCKQRFCDSLGLLQHRKEHVFASDFSIVVPCGKVFSSLKSFLHFYGEFVYVHLFPLKLVSRWPSFAPFDTFHDTKIQKHKPIGNKMKQIFTFSTFRRIMSTCQRK